MEVVDKIILFLHHFNCFFLTVVLLLPYWVTFGFMFKGLFAVLAQFCPSDNHLPGVNTNTDISLLLLHMFNVDDTSSYHLDHLANLLTF